MADLDRIDFIYILRCVDLIYYYKSVTETSLPVLTLRAFYKRHAQFSDLLASNASLTIHRYFRLMALACTDLLCTVPFAAFSIYLNLTAQPLAPYRGWADLHFNYSRVEQIPATIWHLNKKTVISIELSRWMLVVCGFVFFMFFGFAEEARRNYRMASVLIVTSVKRVVYRVFRIKAAPCVFFQNLAYTIC